MNLAQYLSFELGNTSKEEIEELTDIEERALNRHMPKITGDVHSPTKELSRAIRDYNEELSDFHDKLSSEKGNVNLRKSFLGVISYILKKLERHEKGLVVDSGSGTGVDICFLGLKNPNLEFVAYDSCSRMSRKTRERIKKWNLQNIEVVVADHDNLPFRNEVVDLFYTDRSFGEEGKFAYEHTYSELEYNRAKEFGRSLKKKGLVSLMYRPNESMFPLSETKCFAYFIKKENGLKIEGIDQLEESYFSITFRKS